MKVTQHIEDAKGETLFSFEIIPPQKGKSIQELYGPQLNLIDSGLAVARQTARILLKNELISSSLQEKGVRLQCFVSGENAKQLEKVIKHLIQPKITWSVENIVEKLG